MENKVTTTVVKGLMLALVLVVLDLIAGFAHFKFATWFRWIPTLVFCGGIIWSCITYANQNNGNVTFGNVFADGFKTTAVATCITVIYTILSILVIFPETKDVAMDEARKQMEAKGNMPQETIDQAIEMTKKFFVPFAIGGALIGSIIVGAIASLIGAAIAKKNPQTPFQNQP